MTNRYAEKTTVSVEKSKAEIERTLTRYGAQAFMHGWDQEQAVIQFRMNDRQIRYSLPLPAKDAEEFLYTPARRYPRDSDGVLAAWEQAVRQRWRALLLVIKAKLEAVEAGISTFEDEFLAYTVLPDGQTVGDFMLPQVALAYLKGEMPRMLPAPRDEMDEPGRHA